MISPALSTLIGSGPVLVLAPHPDDESLGCGALLASCWEAQLAATVICLTDGGASHPGSRSHPRPRLAALRRIEMATAITALGGIPARDLVWLGHPDAALHRLEQSGANLVQDILDQIDRTGARFLFAPSPLDSHCDHEAGASAARIACRRRPWLRLHFYPVWSRWAGGGAAPRPAGTCRHLLARPHLAVRKSAAIAAHASQRGAVIDDDPGGFAMPAGFAAMFAGGPEIFDELLEESACP